MTPHLFKPYRSYPLPAGQSGQEALVIRAFLRAVCRFIYTRLSDEIVAIVFAVCFLSLGSFIARDFSSSIEELGSRLSVTLVSAGSLGHAAVVVVIAGVSSVIVGKFRGYLREKGFDVSPLMGFQKSYIGRVLTLSLIQSDIFYSAVYFASLLPVVTFVYCIALGFDQFLLLSLTGAVLFSSLLSSLTFGFWLSYFLDHMWWHRLLGLSYRGLMQISFSSVFLILVPPLITQSLCLALLFMELKDGSEISGMSMVLLKLSWVVGLSTFLFPAFSLMTEPRRGFSNGLYAWMFIVFASSLMMFSVWLVPVAVATALYSAGYQSRYFARI